MAIIIPVGALGLSGVEDVVIELGNCEGFLWESVA
jgi:hypothetical protein